MKRLLLAILVLAIVLSFGGCVTKRYKFDDFELSDVESVQIYDLTGYDMRTEEEICESEPFFTLEKERIPEFITALREIEFSDTIILVGAWDPSFNYGEYVVRLNFKNGTYKLMSDGGYNNTWDAGGEIIGGDHFCCDTTEWINFIYRFAGTRSSRIITGKWETPITVADNVRVDEILSSAKKIDTEPDARISDSHYIFWKDQRYHLATDDSPYLKLNSEYYELSAEDNAELRSIIEKYTLY